MKKARHLFGRAGSEAYDQQAINKTPHVSAQHPPKPNVCRAITPHLPYCASDSVAAILELVALHLRRVVPALCDLTGDRKSYSWREDCAAEPAEAPAWLIELLTTPKQPGASTSNGTPASRINGNGDAYARAALDAESTAVASAAPNLPLSLSRLLPRGRRRGLVVADASGPPPPNFPDPEGSCERR
jgi:hypothetical protein